MARVTDERRLSPDPLAGADEPQQESSVTVKVLSLRRVGALTPVAAELPSIRDSEEEWVAAAQRGDTRAFRELFARHHGRVYAMCARLLVDRHEIEDAVQQTFLEAWRSLYRFEGRSRFSTWLTRIAIHTCFGFRRRLRRLWLTADTDPIGAATTPLWSAPPAAPDDAAVQRRQEQAIAEVLHALTPRKRVVFVLAEFEGMTAPEIGRVLKIPDATVRTRLFHARRELAEALRRHPGFADLFPPSSRAEGT